MDTVDRVFISGIIIAVSGFIGMLIGSSLEHSLSDDRIKPYIAARHDYADIRIISNDGRVVVRAVESPGWIDDRSVETIISGKLISRTRPNNFDDIWETTRPAVAVEKSKPEQAEKQNEGKP